MGGNEECQLSTSRIPVTNEILPSCWTGCLRGRTPNRPVTWESFRRRFGWDLGVPFQPGEIVETLLTPPMQLEVLLTRAMLQVPTHTQTTLGIHRVCTNSMLFPRKSCSTKPQTAIWQISSYGLLSECRPSSSYDLPASELLSSVWRELT